MPVPPPPPINTLSPAQQVGKTHATLIKTISVLKVEEGDVIMLECESNISARQYHDMAKVFEDLLVNAKIENVSVIILSSGIKIKTIRPKNKRLDVSSFYS